MEAPKKIYLQWSYGINHPDLEVTWCVDQVAEDEDIDVEYVRGDIVAQLLEALQDLLDCMIGVTHSAPDRSDADNEKILDKAYAAIAAVKGDK